MADPEILNLFTPYLQPGEKILWTGRPSRGLRFVAFDWFLIPFSSFWFLGIMSMLIGASWKKHWTHQDSGGVVFVYFIWTFFVFAGLYMLAGRFIVDFMVRRASVYAMTTERALVRSAWPRVRLADASLKNIDTIVLNEGRARRGSITFGVDDPSGGGRINGSPVFSFLDPTPIFVDIPEARAVYMLAVRVRS